MNCPLSKSCLHRSIRLAFIFFSTDRPRSSLYKERRTGTKCCYEQFSAVQSLQLWTISMFGTSITTEMIDGMNHPWTVVSTLRESHSDRSWLGLGLVLSEFWTFQSKKLDFPTSREVDQSRAAVERELNRVRIRQLKAELAARTELSATTRQWAEVAARAVTEWCGSWV